MLKVVLDGMIGRFFEPIDFSKPESTQQAVILIEKLEEAIFVAHHRDNRFGGRPGYFISIDEKNKMENLVHDIATALGCGYLVRKVDRAVSDSP
jgi:hypothetical protein